MSLVGQHWSTSVDQFLLFHKIYFISFLSHFFPYFNLKNSLRYVVSKFDTLFHKNYEIIKSLKYIGKINFFCEKLIFFANFERDLFQRREILLQYTPPRTVVFDRIRTDGTFKKISLKDSA